MGWDNICEYAEMGCAGAKIPREFDKYCFKSKRCLIYTFLEEKAISLDDVRTEDNYFQIKEVVRGDIGSIR